MSQRFDFVETPLTGLVRVERKPIVDARGFFSRFFCANEFKEIGFDRPVAQMNHTLTRKQGAIRGMHYYIHPHTEEKLVTCIQGKIFDVAVDIRRDSPTYLQWHAEILSDENQSSLYIPQGFAHGFQALTDDCQLFYLHTNIYVPDYEGALNAMDPVLSINWPVSMTEMSERDRNHPMINPEFKGI